MLDTPLTERTGQLTSESEREELRLALVSAQESLAVQILLESCLETEEDRVSILIERISQHIMHLLQIFFLKIAEKAWTATCVARSKKPHMLLPSSSIHKRPPFSQISSFSRISP